MAHKKLHLPERICPVCQRPFSWRRKWADCWDEVKYCSERCRRQKNRPDSRSCSQTAKDTLNNSE
ncbi:DUF2256 domain-containing protein [Parathalassolituus penaei]|uniref:DUF2256 domain-containing protein n=1 Tax=Parathalassolituus penaei TaxID=2997323 RepID=A0A9X3EEF3_9GAMM|nr:DUF2256 domain-containing protein [Parathalassolituus penaei]MCY0966057.1 DUF2256 domain-containing protein [Parathalassolituus penaei]